jgi:hypothetical protein
VSLGHHGEGVRVVDLPRLQLPLSRLDQLCARRENDHLGAPVDRQPPVTLRRRQSYLGGTDLRPHPQDNVPLAHVLAAATYVLPRGRGLLQLELLAPAGGVLHHHDRVGAFRDDPSGEDLDRLPLPDALRRRASRRGFANDLEYAPRFGVGASHRVAVHRRVVEGRRVEPGPQVLRQREPASLNERDLLRGQLVGVLEHQPQGLGVLNELVEELHIRS